MPVIADIEWVETNGSPYPTQLAAIRCTALWEEEERFNALIFPKDGNADFKHVAYSGSSSEAFLLGESPEAALSRFFDWLGDDMIFLWDLHPALAFNKIAEVFLGMTVDSSLRVIRPALKRIFGLERAFGGSPFRTCERLDLPATGIEHRAIDDARTILFILFETELPVEAVLRCALPEDADYSSIDGTPSAAKRNAKMPSSYFIDTKKRLLHSASCPELQKSKELQKCEGFASAIIRGIKPCKCCRAEYNKTLIERAERMIENSDMAYVYEEGGRLFHRAGCMHAKRIPFNKLRGGSKSKYGKIIKRGLEPCGWCNPKPFFDQKTEQPVRAKRKKHTDAEKRAVKLHALAVREMERIENSLLSPAEKKAASPLTDTRYAFFASKGYSTFHIRGCPKLNGASELSGFATFSQAAKRGLKPCKHCNPSNKHNVVSSIPLNSRPREGEEIGMLDALCEKHGFAHSASGTEYIIETPVGIWKLITDARPVILFHINLTMGGREQGYHRQPHMLLSLADTFSYIDRHDNALLFSVASDGSAQAQSRFEGMLRSLRLA